MLTTANYPPHSGQSSRRDACHHARFARMFTLDDLLAIPPKLPKRGRGRPKADEATLERRRLTAWLADTGILPPPKVCRVAGIAPRTLREWRAAERAAS